jgi:hypothetical protein
MIFRYPGGKDRLARKLLKDNTIRYPDISDNEISVYLKDLDNWTAAFWKILISSENKVKQIPAAEGAVLVNETTQPELQNNYRESAPTGPAAK